MLDHQFYGLNPWGYHLTNVLLHAVNTVLLFLVLRRMTGFARKNIGATTPHRATWRSLMVAALFGLHPLRVESVAWISERKDVLSVVLDVDAVGVCALRARTVESRGQIAEPFGTGSDYGFDYVWRCFLPWA